MRQQTFEYRGRSLIEPLKKLCNFFSAEHASLKHRIDTFDPSPLKNVQIVPGHQTPKMKHEGMKAELKVIEANLLIASNWLREAQRCRWKKWILDFADLDWLYRPEPAFGTQGSLKKETISS